MTRYFAVFRGYWFISTYSFSLSVLEMIQGLQCLEMVNDKQSVVVIVIGNRVTNKDLL